ncbi:MAG TPA: hypothetical protein V6D00_03200 [Pantanalinema sp.]
MQHGHHAFWTVPLVVLGLAGCATLETRPFAQFYTSGQPSIAGVAPYQSRLMFSVIREGEPERSAQAITGLTYSTVGVTLTNTDTSLLPSALTKNVTLDGGNQAASVFSALRPGGGYSVSVSLKDAGSTQVGSGVAENVSLPAGMTTPVTIVIGRDGNVKVASSTTGNGFGTSSAYVVAKGDSVVLNTGFSGTETAVASWSVSLSSSLYGTNAKIAAYPASTNFSTFTWSTAAAASNGGFSYAPANLTTMGTQDGDITFELYDSANKVIGRSVLSHVSVVNGAAMSITLQ